eukprot:gene6724-10889_t
MGNEQSFESEHTEVNLTKEKLKNYKRLTKEALSSSDIKKLYKLWYELYPSGSATKEEFKSFATKSLPDVPQDDSVEYLFSSMDLDKDGHITFLEFLIYQSVTCPTSNIIDTEELIKLTFIYFDENGDGIITIPELRRCFVKMFKAAGEVKTSLEIEDRIQEVMKISDTNHDQKISHEEFMKAFQKNPKILIA